MLCYVILLINLNSHLDKFWQYEDTVYDYKAEIHSNENLEFSSLESVIYDIC